MSNSKSAIKEIKNLMVQFGFLKNDEVELQSFKLEDNTILNKVDAEDKKYRGKKEKKSTKLMTLLIKYH